MEFGKYFKKCRKQSGKTQKQVADHLRVYQSNLSDWVNNVSRPLYENLLQLAKFYGVTLYELLGQDDPLFSQKNE